jgi:hypothetical protein
MQDLGFAVGAEMLQYYELTVERASPNVAPSVRRGCGWRLVSLSSFTRVCCQLGVSSDVGLQLLMGCKSARRFATGGAVEHFISFCWAVAPSSHLRVSKFRLQWSSQRERERERQ